MDSGPCTKNASAIGNHRSNGDSGLIPSKAIDPSEINKVNAEYSKTMQTIVGQLDAAPAMLTLLAKELDERMKNVDERYRRAWQKKIQAGIDLGQIKP